MSALAPPDPQLTDGVVRLEPLSAADRDDTWAMVQDADIRRFTLLPSDLDPSFVPRWLERYERGWDDGSCAGFSIRDAASGAYLGFASLVRLDLERREAELGYMVAPEARGRGVSVAAVRLLTRWAFDELGLERLELRIDEQNAASRRVAERAGYRLEGVLRSLAFKEGLRADTGVWSRLPGDPD